MAVVDAAPRLLTADDLLRLSSQGVRGELIRGVLSDTMPTGREHGRVVVNLAAELRAFAKPRRLGILTASDSGVWLDRDPDTVREPDIAFFFSGDVAADRAGPRLRGGRARPGGGGGLARQ